MGKARILLQLLLGKGCDASAQLQPVRVKGLHPQAAVPAVKEVAGREDHVSSQLRRHQLGRTRVE